MENSQNGAKSLAQEREDRLTFEKLTPTSLSDDEMKGYTEALDFVFQEDDLLNIAITGPYASGKSSVIKTYEEKHKNLNGIHISLSYFSPILESKIRGKKKEDELAFEDELMLERKIINQLIHQIDSDKIPATEFKVKSESKKWTGIICSVIISLIIIYVTYKNETWFTDILNKHPFISIAFFGVFIASVAYYIFRLQRGKNIIGKLKIFENEIDISTSRSSCDVSYFDKYLNEIIYILDRSELDYIVFEDIDRYDDNLILNKLRELNYIYNKKQIKNKPKQLKFLYLIKDEIFESKERTKFFDYILPIVPVMDNSNSLGKIQEIFKAKKISGDFSETFLNTLSLYLDDIRLIKNICNEYLIYKNKLVQDISWFKYEKLLAIIVYKNIFPADFSLTRLGLGQGVVHRIIKSLKDQKNEIYEERNKNIDKKTQELRNELELLNSNFLQNMDELDAIYFNFHQDFEQNIYQYVGQKNIAELNQIEFIIELKKNDWLITNGKDPQNSYYFRSKTLKSSYEKIQTNPEYNKRKKIITSMKEKKQQDLREQIKALEKGKTQINLPKSIVEIIKRAENNGTKLDVLLEQHIEKEESLAEQYKKEYFKLSSSCYFPLLKHFIGEGYIDEHYSDYMTFFNSNGLSSDDVQFLRNIKERANNEWDLELRKPALVLQTLNTDSATRFTGNSVLNYSLLDYILIANETTDLSLFINLLKSQHKVDFVNAYLSRYYNFLINADTRYQQKYLYIFIERLNEQFPQIWQYIDLFGQKLYLYLSFIHSQETILDEMNQDNKLKEFIDDSSDFLLIYEEWNTLFNLLDERQYNLSKIGNAFLKLNVKFQHIKDSTPHLLELVEKNNNYQLNTINAKYIIENKYDFIYPETCIIQIVLSLKDNAPIRLYFQSNQEELVLSITQSEIETIKDNEETVLFVLNNDKISSAAKIAYIDKLSTIIGELNQITDKSVWDTLLEKQRIQYSAENIVHYFFNYELGENDNKDENNNEKRIINEQLTNFINNNDKKISVKEAKLSNLITKDNEISLFFRRITINTDLENTKYSMLISWFNNRHYYNFNFRDIDKEKISILIKCKAIKLQEKQNLNFIRENYPDNLLELITHNFNDYINKLQNDNSLVNHDEIISLLSTDLSLEQKTSLLNLTGESISINHVDYPPKIQKYILENNFDIDDLVHITSEQFYNSTTNEIKAIIKQLCIEYKTQILELEQICYDLLIELFILEDLSLDDQYILLCNQINHLNAEQTYNAFKIIEKANSINESCFSDLFIFKRPRFEPTNLNKRITEQLNKKWKFNFTEDDNNQIIGNGKKLITI